MRARLMIVARDPYPLFRVDLTELVGRWLTQRYDVEWVLRGEAAAAVGGQAERFLVGRGLTGWIRIQARCAVRVMLGRADLVQVRDAALSALFFLAAARARRLPFVFWISFPITDDYRRRALVQPPGRPWLRLARLAYAVVAGAVLRRIVLPAADHVFVQSKQMKADLAAQGLGTSCMTAVPMGVSLAAYANIPPTDDRRLRDKKALVYVGAQGPERPLEAVIDALALASARFDVVLVLIGDRTEEDRVRLIQAAQAVGVEGRVLLLGYMPLQAMLGYVRRADVCLSPFPTAATYRSATPTKLVEYLAMGRPVVASEHPDQRRVIEESGAGLIAPPTAGAFADAILALLADPVAAEAMGAKGPAWVAAHRDYAKLSAEVAAVYDKLLGVEG